MEAAWQVEPSSGDRGCEGRRGGRRGQASQEDLGDGNSGGQGVAPKLVQYQEMPKNNQKCSDCLHFIASDQCKVEGKIKPNGWCALFAPKPK
jgi:hypothetical protein